MREQKLILFRPDESETLFYDMFKIMENYDNDRYKSTELSALFYNCLNKLVEQAGAYGFHGNLWHCYLTNLLLNMENAYTLACERRGEISGSINLIALHDLDIYRSLYDYNFKPMMDKLRVQAFEVALNYKTSDLDSAVYNKRICSRIVALAQVLAEQAVTEDLGLGKLAGKGPDFGQPSPQALAMKKTLTRFYQEVGVAKFGLHKSFRVERDENGVNIVPIRNIAHVKFNDLVGYETQKQKLRENTDAFAAGKKANNCLLFGDAGTGKSSCIKAIANEYYDKGIRVIEIYKHQFQDLNDVIAQIKNRNYKFIIFMDDLSFEDFEVEYKYLKAVIEGGLEKRPDNVLIYATSNRRHLIKETWSDRDDMQVDNGIHKSDTIQEKLSLSYRFGVTVYFESPDKKHFQEIVLALGDRYKVNMAPEDLLLEANKWELAHGGLTGRTAQQFIDYLLGKQ